MSAARALIVWGGLYATAAILLVLLLELRRPLPSKARTIRNMAACIGFGVFWVGVIGASLGL